MYWDQGGRGGYTSHQAKHSNEGGIFTPKASLIGRHYHALDVHCADMRHLNHRIAIKEGGYWGSHIMGSGWERGI